MSQLVNEQIHEKAKALLKKDFRNTCFTFVVLLLCVVMFAGTALRFVLSKPDWTPPLGPDVIVIFVFSCVSLFAIHEIIKLIVEHVRFHRAVNNKEYTYRYAEIEDFGPSRSCFNAYYTINGKCNSVISETCKVKYVHVFDCGKGQLATVDMDSIESKKTEEGN